MVYTGLHFYFNLSALKTRIQKYNNIPFSINFLKIYKRKNRYIKLTLLTDYNNKFMYYLIDHLPQRRSQSSRVSGALVEPL